MARLNTKRLLRQCQAMAKKQKTAAKQSEEISIKTNIDIKGEVERMTPNELEQYLTEFIKVIKDADRRFDEATRNEIYPNEAIQDILHTAEFAPSVLQSLDVVSELNKYRKMRRTAKQELEVMTVFKEWVDTNRTALNKLENLIGIMRKILQRQPNDYYIFKTDAVGEENKPLIIDEE